MTKKNTTDGKILRARDVSARYYGICGLLFLLGLADLLFMIVICLMAGHSGSTKMLLLLDVLWTVPVIGMMLCYLQTAAVYRRDIKNTCAAAERRSDGTVRLEYRVGQKRYGLELGKEKRVEAAGMISVWYDARNPRNVFFGSTPPQKVPLFWPANLGALLLICAAINAIFVLFLR